MLNFKLNDNMYVIGILMIIVYLYSAHMKLNSDDILTSLFKNDIFRVFFLSLLIIIDMNDSPTISILIAMLFVIIMNRIMIKETKEGFGDIFGILNNMYTTGDGVGGINITGYTGDSQQRQLWM